MGSSMKFTDRQIKNLKQDCTRYEVWEGNGLGIRVSPKGTKTWIFLYRFEGKARRMTLGRYPIVTVGEAHKKHGKALEDLENSIDPGAVEVEVKQMDRKAPTVKAVADEYMEKWAKARKKSWKEDQRILDKDVLPHWERKKAKDITRRDVILLLDGIVARGAPVQANRTLAVIRRMYNFAVNCDLTPTSPCVAVETPSKERQRDRVLTQAEVKTLWVALDMVGKEARIQMSKGTALALKLQLVTAQRKGEIISAEWSEIDLASRWWTIPPEKAKNGITHRVYLSSLATKILEEIKSDHAKSKTRSKWLFPSPIGDKHITGPAVNHAVRRNSNELGVEYFTPHDLRRTAVSHMTSMGISRLVVSKILNHVESGITAVYDRHSYDNEKKLALDIWSQKLEELTGGVKAVNVINMVDYQP